jgi:hypothetical protein
MAQTSLDVTIARWRKYGRDRLYVARADGTKLGYWDLVTDEAHPERPELVGILELAHLRWARSALLGGPRRPPDWRDRVVTRQLRCHGASSPIFE